MSLDAHLAYLEAEYAAAVKAPLSARQVLLVAVLLDKYPDRVFAEFRHSAPERVFRAEDMPAYRAELRGRFPALREVFDLCMSGAEASQLVTQAVSVPLAEYGSLPIADFMVSLYNNHTVQRVLLQAADGRTELAHPMLADALEVCRGL